MAVSRMQSIAGIAVAVAAVASLPGCSGKEAADATSRPSEPVPASSSAPAPTTLSPRTEKWTALQAGQCLADAPPTDPAVVTVTLVDCTQPHLAEVYLRADIPVNEALSNVAGSQCDAGFTAYTGMTVPGSGYTTTYLIDSDQDRTDNNPYPSTVICLLQDTQGRSLTGSAAKT
jgi:hypothetical protein